MIRGCRLELLEALPSVGDLLIEAAFVDLGLGCDGEDYECAGLDPPVDRAQLSQSRSILTPDRTGMWSTELGAEGFELLSGVLNRVTLGGIRDRGTLGVGRWMP